MPKKEILYITDPLCGWCYGFGPVVKAFHEKYQHEFSFAVWCGGMITGDRVEPISKMRSYIEQSFPNVEAMTGVKFGENYFKNILHSQTYISNSEKPSIALNVFKSLKPEKQVEFAHDIQYALYFDGKDLNQDASYQDLVKNFGIDPDSFIEKLNREEFKSKTLEEFAMVKQLGVNGFPTLLYKKGEKAIVLSRGYQSFESLDRTFQSLS
jgi:putative protein-disulfide isomerase